MRAEYRTANGKMKMGPGGMRCSCCCPLNCHPRKAKPIIRRYFRRKAKLELKRHEQE